MSGDVGSYICLQSMSLIYMYISYNMTQHAEIGLYMIYMPVVHENP